MSIHFEIEPPYLEALRAAGLDSFDALMAARGGDATSAHAERETVPLDVPIGGTIQRCFLKRVFRVPFKHAVVPWLRGRRARSQPLHEWHMLGALHAAGIGAMQRIAVGEQRSTGRPIAACLLVASVPARETLDHWLDPAILRGANLPPRQRARLLAAVGALTGRLIRRGFSWPDFQPKHVFAEWRSDAMDWSLWLIDVERMEHRPRGAPPTEPEFAAEAWRLLERIGRALPMARFSWRDVLHLAAAARREAGLAPVGKRPVDPQDRYSRRPLKYELISSYLARSTRPTVPDDQWAMSSVRRLDGYKLLAEYEDLFRTNQLDSFDRLFHLASDADLHKPGLAAHRSRGRFTLTDAAGGEHTFYLKRYHHPPTADQLRRIFSGSPVESSASREYRCIKRLNQIGISTLRGVAVGQRMVGLTERQSFLITAALDDISLERYAAAIARGDSPPPAPRLRREIVTQLALVARTLHAAECFHRDLYLSHVFLHRNADGSVALRLIDLARMLVKPRQTLRWRIKDLAALDYSAPQPLVTRADRLRFLICYFNPFRNSMLVQSLGGSHALRHHLLRQSSARSAREALKQALRYHIPLVAARVRKMAEHDARRSRRNAHP